MQQKSIDCHLENWMRRTRKQLAASGRMTELALLISLREGGRPADWSDNLRGMLDGSFTPTLDLVTLIDTLLAKPRQAACKEETASLF